MKNIYLFIFLSLFTINLSGQTTDALSKKDSTFYLLGQDTIFTKVDQEITFPGGYQAWRQLLMLKLNASIPVEKGAPEGTYKVIVSFIVDKDGVLSNIVADTDWGFGMEMEAIRVIKKGPNWKPAKINGRSVKSIQHQPITFAVIKD